MAADPFLSVRGLCKSFAGRPAIQNVKFSLERGRTLGLVGPSGSGKSTLARCLALFETPPSGEIWLAGRNLCAANANIYDHLGNISAGRAAVEHGYAHRHALEGFLGEMRIEQRHYTRENKLLLHNRKCLVLQERMCFRNLPLSDWIEHEIPLEDGADLDRLVQDMTVFDKSVVSIADRPRSLKALA